jgi:hypothetical protein
MTNRAKSRWTDDARVLVRGRRGRTSPRVDRVLRIGEADAVAASLEALYHDSVKRSSFPIRRA